MGDDYYNFHSPSASTSSYFPPIRRPQDGAVIATGEITAGNPILPGATSRFGSIDLRHYQNIHVHVFTPQVDIDVTPLWRNSPTDATESEGADTAFTISATTPGLGVLFSLSPQARYMGILIENLSGVTTATDITYSVYAQYIAGH